MDWKNKPYFIFNKVKQQMYAKGIQNFYYVDQFIHNYDPQYTFLLSQHAFNVFTNKVGVFLTTQQIRNIKDIYGKNGLIAYRQFFQDVKYSIPQQIYQLITQAYEKLDPNNTGNVQLQKIISNYNCNGHPHVITRRKSPQQVYQAFTNGITRKAVDNFVSKQQFIDYYAQMNFCVPNQHKKFFVQLLNGTWNLINKTQHVSQQRIKQIEHILYQKVRQKSDGKTQQWKCAKKALSYFDLNDQKQCDFKQFCNALDKFGCNFKQKQCKAIFNKYDLNKSGKLDYVQFSKMLMGIDINGMQSRPNLLKTLGTNYFKITH